MIIRENQPQSPQANLDFQEFLFDQNIGRRNSVMPVRPSLKAQERPLSDKFWKTVNANAGYLVSPSDIAQALYGSQDESDRRAVVTLGFHIKKHLDPISRESFLVKRIGCGIGIKDFAISYQPELNILYTLWQHSNKFVSLDDLAVLEHGSNEDKNRRSVQKRILNLKELHFSSVGIERGLFPDRGINYRLHLIPSEHESDLHTEPEDDRKEDIFSEAFQHWLIRENIMIRNNNFGAVEFKDQQFHSDRQKAAISMLNDHYGYLVSYDDIGTAYFGRCKPKNWKKQLLDDLYTLRNSLEHPEDILTVDNIGLGLGIKEVGFTKSLIDPLFGLWKNMGKFVAPDQISEKPDVFIANDVSAIRKIVAPRGYSIGNRIATPRPEYIMVPADGFAEAA